jgi:hypothetical protein
MAYDENGKFYLDDYEQEIYNDEVKREQIREIVQNQKKAAGLQQEYNSLWNDVLKEERLDSQTYEQLFTADPESAKVVLKNAMKGVAKNLKRGKAPHPETRQLEKDPRATLDALHQKARKGPLSREDELDVLDAIFGTEPL